jgi:Family of unknown function (DUF6131)
MRGSAITVAVVAALAQFCVVWVTYPYRSAVKLFGGSRDFSSRSQSCGTIGIVLVVIGAILAILGSTGRAIGGRRHCF